MCRDENHAILYFGNSRRLPAKLAAASFDHRVGAAELGADQAPAEIARRVADRFKSKLWLGSSKF